MNAPSILVVDDEYSICQLLVLVLGRMGARITCAANGLEALRILAEEDFDVVISDVVMPEMGGVELIPRIRQMRPQTYIIAMSGGGRTFMGNLCPMLVSKLGADAAVLKPFSLSEISGEVEKALSVLESARGSTRASA
jgi:CheY-like chemotaxis protein